MMGLQSPRYEIDLDYKDAVDEMLAVIALAEGAGDDGAKKEIK